MRVKAYAKINLFLDILSKRPDGYHDIDSVMQSVGLYDEIEIEKSASNRIDFFCNEGSISNENNIILKACRLFFEYSGFETGLTIRVDKRIPLAAGLGGGSADAAATLAALNRLSGKNYSEDQMLLLCGKLGADVPFCYLGGTARAQLTGEKLTKLPTPKLYFVLLKEGDKRSTGAMYSQLDELSLKAQKLRLEDMLSGIAKQDNKLIVSSAYNSFEHCWDFAAMSNTFSVHSPEGVFLSGSGPTVVAAFDDKSSAEKCYECMKSEGRNVFFAESMSVGYEIV